MEIKEKIKRLEGKIDDLKQSKIDELRFDALESEGKGIKDYLVNTYNLNALIVKDTSKLDYQIIVRRK